MHTPECEAYAGDCTVRPWWEHRDEDLDGPVIVAGSLDAIVEDATFEFGIPRLTGLVASGALLPLHRWGWRS